MLPSLMRATASSAVTTLLGASCSSSARHPCRCRGVEQSDLGLPSKASDRCLMRLIVLSSAMLGRLEVYSIGVRYAERQYQWTKIGAFTACRLLVIA